MGNRSLFVKNESVWTKDYERWFSSLSQDFKWTSSFELSYNRLTLHLLFDEVSSVVIDYSHRIDYLSLISIPEGLVYGKSLY